MTSLQELDDFIAAYNKKRQLENSSKHAEQNDETGEINAYIIKYKEVKNNEMKPLMAKIIGSLNKAQGVKATVNYVKKYAGESIGFEVIKLHITRNGTSYLTLKITPGIAAKNIILNIEKGPDFERDKKLEIDFDSFNSQWLTNLVLNEFRDFMKS